MKAKWTFIACWPLAWAAVVPAATTTQPAASRPTTTSAPATSRPAKIKLSPAMIQKWRWYNVTWAGSDIKSQSNSDQQLVEAILKAEAAEVATLRDVMAQEYDRLAGLKKPDDFHCARLASRLAVAWTRAPTGRDVSAVEMALTQKETCEEACRWALRSMRHFAGQVGEKYLERYKAFVPGTVISMMSLIDKRAPFIDKPSELREELLKIREDIMKTAKADQARQAQTEQQFERFYESLAPLEKLQADKTDIRKLVLDFQAAYNARDDKAFGALWPQGHPATKFLANRTLASKIEPTHWTILRWEPAYIFVKGDLAQAYIVSQYRGKDGLDAAVQLQAFPAKRDPKAGWKLN